MARPATIDEVVELLRSAWAIVEDAGLPERIHLVAFSETVRILAADRPGPPPAEPITPTPLDPY